MISVQRADFVAAIEAGIAASSFPEPEQAALRSIGLTA